MRLTLIALCSVQTLCFSSLPGLPRAAIAPRLSSGVVMRPDVDYDGGDSWDDQLAEQARWMADQQMGAYAAGPWEQQQQQQMRSTDPGLRHDELSAVRQAAWMAEQQMHEQQQHHQQQQHQQQHYHEQQQPYQQQQQQAHDLPAGWTSGLDDATGTMFYCFEPTGQCQWERPAPQHGGYH